jgi:nicotinamidase-related amidase
MLQYACAPDRAIARSLLVSWQLTDHTALLVVDVQCGFDDPRWGERNNLGAEALIFGLLLQFRSAHRPVVHVWHDSPAPDGAFRLGTPGHLPKAEALPLADEPVYRKRVNSAFIGTSLERDLRAASIDTLVIVGLTTNHCISTTARMAGNLGFATCVVADATAAFERPTVDGRRRAPGEVHEGALSDLSGEFATIVDAGAVAAAIRRAPHSPRGAGVSAP